MSDKMHIRDGDGAGNFLHPAAAAGKGEMALEQQLDLLVDDELPEASRREVLVGLDRRPEGWRRLAVRFLERQTERKTLRDFMTERPARTVFDFQRAPLKGERNKSWLRAAGLVVLAGLSVGVMMLMNQGNGGKSHLQQSGFLPSNVTASLPANILGGGDEDRQVNLKVPVQHRDGNIIPALDDADTVPAKGSVRHLVFVRDASGRLFVFGATTDNVQ